MDFSRSLRPIKIKQAECVSWKGKKTLCHSSLAIVVSHMPDNLSLKEKGKKKTLPGEKPSLFSHAPLQGLSNDVISMTATVAQSCPGAIELQPWQANWV